LIEGSTHHPTIKEPKKSVGVKRNFMRLPYKFNQN